MKDSLYAELLAKVRLKASLYEDLDDDLIRGIIDDVVVELTNDGYIDLQKRQGYKIRAFNAIRRLDILQPLVEDESISEIMINSTKDIFVEQEGEIKKLDYSFDSLELLEHVIQTMVGKVDRTVNESVPIVDARLENGSRINVVLPPIALNGPTVTIRKFPEHPLGFDDIVENGTISREALALLIDLVKRRYNIFISGGTSSGKTTFLNILSNAIPADERIITIEDSAELNIKSVANIVRMETRNMNVEGKGEVSIRNLIKTSLRMRPDRIIVGEVRGAEVIDMLQAMNTGHDGSLSTGHANSSKDMLVRLETMVLMDMNMPMLAVRQMIDSGIDVIVHLSKLDSSKRRVTDISELVGLEGGEFCLNTLFKYDEKKDGLIKENELLGCKREAFAS